MGGKVFRYINISVFALAIAGVASAGGIDPTVAGYSTTDGSLFTSAACTGSYCSSITSWASLTSGLNIVDSANPFSESNITSYSGSGGAPQTAASPTPGAPCPYSNMFGGGPSICEGIHADDFIFAGPNSGATTYSVTIAVPSETIYGFQIYLQDDSNSGNGSTFLDHGVTNVKFYDNTSSPSIPVTNDSITAANTTYAQTYDGAYQIELTDAFFAGVTGSSFTFTFTSDANQADAPRIWEIDAFSSPVPEPGTWMLAGLGMLGLFAATKMRNRRLQSKL
jgi:hypothetical protein